jgi:hypothetical protein
MNKQNFIQSGGFPFQTETLDEMQKAFRIFNAFGYIAGNFSIISGCEVTGSLVNDGIVFLNGEVFEFKGGQIGNDVIIVEEITAQEFEDGNDKDVIYVRYVTFGIGGVSYPWTNFKRPKTTIELTEQKAEQTLIELLITRITNLESRPTSNVPVGMIAIWDRPANEIPVGWVEYLPLRGRTPIGLDPNDNDLDSLGVNVGSKTKTLVGANIPKIDFNDRGVTGSGNTDDSPGGGTPYYVPNSQLNSIGNINPTAFDVLNPVRVVHFIKYTG